MNLKKMYEKIKNKRSNYLILGVIAIGLLASITLLSCNSVKEDQTNLTSAEDQVPSMEKATNKYESVDYSKVEYKDGKIISPILPYTDFSSLFNKLPLGHTKATGAGINIGVVSSDKYIDLTLLNSIYYTARDSEVYTTDTLSIDQLLKHSINIVVLENVNIHDTEDITQFVKDCIKENISVVIPGDIPYTDSEINLTNLLEKEGAITVGRLQRQGVPYNMEKNRQPYNNRLYEININIFASGIIQIIDITDYKQALGSVGGALALVLEEKQLNPIELKSHLLENSRDVWMMYDISDGKRMDESISLDSVTSQYIPKEDSSIYFYKQLDFEKLMNIELGNSWASNIYNTYKAWDISKGNVDVAIIDQGFHPDAPFLKNNVVEAKAFRDIEWNGNFHGTSMAKALLSIAPEAKLHLLLAVPIDGQTNVADTFIEAIDYCIQENITIISTSLSAKFTNSEKLINKMQEAKDKGITIVWFHYPNKESGIIKPTFAYFKDETDAQNQFMTGFTLSAFDRFIEEDSMFYPQEIGAGLSYTAPIGAGLVALIKEVNPDITPEEIEELLIDDSAVTDNNKKRPAIPDMYEILKKLKNN